MIIRNSNGQFIGKPRASFECKICNKVFIAPSWKIRKYCSYKCYWIGRVGTPAWNKGKKGIHLSPDTEFQKGQNIGKQHRLWKGENAGYHPIHSWVKNHKGKPQICIDCGKPAKHWSNIDHKYHRNLDDYVERCVNCHREYDFKNNLTRKVWT